MKAIFFLLAIFILTVSANAQISGKSQPDSTQKIMVVDASCGQCKFKLEGPGCDLAVRMGGKAYFVDGTSIDEHGDAHAKDGFCNAIRKAEVQGKLVKNRFQATYFRLVSKEEEIKPMDKKENN